MPPFVKLEALRYQADANATPIVADDLGIEEGTSAALMGANGAGKSTLLALCSGLIRPDSGRVLIDGEDLATLDGRQIFSLAAGTFQDPSDQIFLPTVRQEVEFGLRQQRLTGEEISRRVENATVRLGLMPVPGEEAARLAGGRAPAVDDRLGDCGRPGVTVSR